MNSKTRPKVLFVINKKIPENDYRLQYVNSSDKFDINIALPQKPLGLVDDKYLCMKFCEGLSIRNLFELFNLWKYLVRDKSINTVHFFSTILIIFGPFITKFSNKFSIITITGLGRTFDNNSKNIINLFSIQKFIYKNLMGNSIKCTKSVLFQNRLHIDIFSKWYPEHKHKFIYIGSSTNTKISLPNKKINGDITVLLIARIMPSKGIVDFLEVASRLTNCGFRFELVGPYSVGHSKLLTEVKRKDKEKVITYHGELETGELIKKYIEADILLFPSYGEGLSRVMLEAGHLGLCPVAYDIDANKDLISHGRGFLVSKHAIHEIIRILEYLQQNREVIYSNAINYQEYILDTYSMEKYISKMDSIINRNIQQTLKDY